MEELQKRTLVAMIAATTMLGITICIGYLFIGEKSDIIALQEKTKLIDSVYAMEKRKEIVNNTEAAVYAIRIKEYDSLEQIQKKILMKGKLP